MKKINFFLSIAITVLLTGGQIQASDLSTFQQIQASFDRSAVKSILLQVNPPKTDEKPKTPALSKDIQWVRKSSEYTALCVQAYNLAARSVKEMAVKETGKWVVVLDVDETVLDNSQYQLEIAQRGETFSPATWDAWVRREQAHPIPGSKAFMDTVRALGGSIAFITNREASQEVPTINNMKALGLFKDGDIMLGRANKQDTKEVRRACLTSGTGRCTGKGPLKILALVGDQIQDFVEVSKPEEIESLKKNMDQDSNWGTRYFMLPNPMYGGWERLP